MEEHVLLVDDDPKFRAALSLAAAENGFIVAQACTLKSADFELRLRSFDLIIVNSQQPDGNAFNWIASVRSHGNLTSVIYVSEQAQDGLAFHKVVQEVSLVLQKPVSIKALGNEIRHLLDSQKTSLNFESANALLMNDMETDLPAKMDTLTLLARAYASQKDDERLLKKTTGQVYLMRCTLSLCGFVHLTEKFKKLERMLNEISSCSEFDQDDEHWSRFALELSSVAESLHSTLERRAHSLPTRPEAGPRTLNPNKLPRVLLLDEDRIFNQRLKSLLAAESIIVYTFQEIAVVNDIIDYTEPDLILLGPSFATNGGGDFSDLIQGQRFRRNIPLVVLTDGESFASGICSDFCQHVLNKRLGNIELLSLLRSYIELKSVERPRTVFSEVSTTHSAA